MYRKMAFHFPHSTRFFAGVVLIVGSFVFGLLSKIWLVVYFQDGLWRWAPIIIYFLSWVLLIFGAWIVGVEYAESVRKYTSYSFYHNTLRDGTTQAIHKTRELKEKVKGKIQEVKKPYTKLPP